jgi:hypothetical protein
MLRCKHVTLNGEFSDREAELDACEFPSGFASAIFE